MKEIVRAVLISLLGFPWSPSGVAQSFDFDPQRWYPLEVGSYWHYISLDMIDTYVVKTTGDTLVNGVTWTELSAAYCYGPSCPRRPEWRRFTDDHYVERTWDFVAVDTLWQTTPRSIFTTNMPYDSTLQSIYAVGESTRRPGFVDVFVDSIEVESASWPLLRAHLGFTGEVYCGFFIYDIGYTRDCSSPGA